MSPTTPPSFRSAMRAGTLVWFPLLGSIGAWAVHLVALAALARVTCTNGDKRWILHAITAGCLVIALGATALSAKLLRSGTSDDSASDESGRSLFLGRLAVGVCAFNVVLIAVEEALVVTLRGHGCG